MSVFYCFVCDKHIDSDYDAEHLESCPETEEIERANAEFDAQQKWVREHLNPHTGEEDNGND